MEGAQAALDVHPCPHFFGRTDQDAHPAGVDNVEEIHLGLVAVGVVDEGDGVFGDACGGQPLASFSGYGPARYFRAAQVRELSEELRRPEVESEAAARFDSAKMSQLRIHTGWRAGEQDKEWLMDAFGRLRDFYSSAAAQGRAIITCLV
jgi:hypothetical protein